MKKFQRLLTLAFLASLTIVGLQQATMAQSEIVVVVNNEFPECRPDPGQRGFQSIQLAINNINSGTTAANPYQIRLCPGVYNESPRISGGAFGNTGAAASVAANAAANAFNVQILGSEPRVTNSFITGSGAVTPLGFTGNRKPVIRPLGTIANTFINNGPFAATGTAFGLTNSSSGCTSTPGFTTVPPLDSFNSTGAPVECGANPAVGNQGGSAGGGVSQPAMSPSPTAFHTVPVPFATGVGGTASGATTEFPIVLVASGAQLNLFDVTVDGSQIFQAPTAGPGAGTSGGTTFATPGGGAGAAVNRIFGVLVRNAFGNIDRVSVRNTFSATVTGVSATNPAGAGATTTFATGSAGIGIVETVPATSGSPNTFQGGLGSVIIQQNAIENFAGRGISVDNGQGAAAGTGGVTANSVFAIVTRNSIRGRGLVANGAVAGPGGGAGTVVGAPGSGAANIQTGIFASNNQATISFNEILDLRTSSCASATADPNNPGGPLGSFFTFNNINPAVYPVIPPNANATLPGGGGGGTPGSQPTFGSSGELPTATANPVAQNGSAGDPGAPQACLSFGINTTNLRGTGTGSTGGGSAASSINSNSIEFTDAGMISSNNNNISIDANNIHNSLSNGLSLFFTAQAGTINQGGANGSTVTRNLIFNARRAGLVVFGTNNNIGGTTIPGQGGNFVNDADIAYIIAGPVGSPGAGGGTGSGNNVGIGPTAPTTTQPNNGPNNYLGNNGAYNVRLSLRINGLPGGISPQPPPRPEAAQPEVELVIPRGGKTLR